MKQTERLRSYFEEFVVGGGQNREGSTSLEREQRCTGLIWFRGDGCINRESVVFRGCLNVKRMGPSTLTQKSPHGTVKLWDVTELSGVPLLVLFGSGAGGRTAFTRKA